jgi:hypothetical protein
MSVYENVRFAMFDYRPIARVWQKMINECVFFFHCLVKLMLVIKYQNYYQ